MTVLRRLARSLASLPGLVIIGVARGWQWGPSRVLPPSCRFTPSCSQYAIEAVRRHGAIKGGLLALWRLLRCQPWGGHGHDPVPERTDRKGRCGCPARDNDPPDA